MSRLPLFVPRAEIGCKICRRSDLKIDSKYNKNLVCVELLTRVFTPHAAADKGRAIRGAGLTPPRLFEGTGNAPDISAEGGAMLNCGATPIAANCRLTRLWLLL